MKKCLTRRDILMIAAVVAASSVLPSASGANPEHTQPSIILVFIDDMGWADFSCFGNQDAKTPNIDRMAIEGVAFEQFYVNSPNGCEKGAGQAGPLKGYKTHLFEGGIRSSLIAWAPGLMPQQAQGTRNKDSVFAAIDLAPCLLKLTGAKPPAKANYDGEDLLDTLLGKSRQSRQAPLFFSRPPDRKNYYGFKNLPDLAVRHGRWKLLCDYDGGRANLYNVITDPGESRNLAGAQPEVTKDLLKKLMDWYQSMPSSEPTHSIQATPNGVPDG